MNKLILQLRDACTGGITCRCSYKLAAEEIERLEKEKAELQAKLDQWSRLAPQVTLR